MVRLLRDVTVELNRLAHAFARRHALHPTDVRALIVLVDEHRAGREVTPGRLAALLDLGSPATTALVDRLDRAGHVRRERDATDRRRVRLVVTDAAFALGQAHFGPLLDRLAAVTAGFAPAELATVGRFLDAVQDAVRDAVGGVVPGAAGRDG